MSLGHRPWVRSHELHSSNPRERRHEDQVPKVPFGGGFWLARRWPDRISPFQMPRQPGAGVRTVMGRRSWAQGAKDSGFRGIGMAELQYG